MARTAAATPRCPLITLPLPPLLPRTPWCPASHPVHALLLQVPADYPAKLSLMTSYLRSQQFLNYKEVPGQHCPRGELLVLVEWPNCCVGDCWAVDGYCWRGAGTRHVHPPAPPETLLLRHTLDYSTQDPYYGGTKGFELVLDLLDDACEGLLEAVQQQRR